MKNRLFILFFVLALLALNVVPLSGQTLPQPGDEIIITAESAPVYAYPDASGVAINIVYQGSVDRMGLPGGADWAYLAEQGGYVRLDESGLAIRTDVLQQKLLKAVTSEIEQDQGTVDAFIRRGTIQMYMQHNYEAAVEDYTRAIELAPDDGRAYAQRGWVLWQMHQLTRAAADFEQAITLGETHARTLNGLGFTYEEAELYEKAEYWYQQAADQYPGTGVGINGLGNMRYNEMDYDAALDYYDQLTAIDPYATAAYFNRALVYRHQDDYAAALAELNKAVERDPYNPEAYIHLSVLYTYYLDDVQTGLDNVDMAIAIDPEYSEAYEERATIYAYEIGDSQQAIADLDTAIRVDPYNVSAIYEAAGFYARVGEFDRALDYFDQTHDFEPLPMIFYLYRAQIYYCQGDYGRTKKDVELFVKAQNAEYINELTLAYLILAMTALQEGDYVEARNDYSIAFSLTPEWTRDWSTEKGYRLIDSRVMLAATYAQNIQDNPDAPENYLQLAHILMEFGVWEEGLDYYRQYLTMVDDPDLESVVLFIEAKLEAD